nr:hypothetical protein HT591_02395 [Klebsiella pneumoniae]
MTDSGTEQAKGGIGPRLAAPRKTARLRRRENRAALTRRPHFLSASSLFAACCLSAFSSSFCCDVSF